MWNRFGIIVRKFLLLLIFLNLLIFGILVWFQKFCLFLVKFFMMLMCVNLLKILNIVICQSLLIWIFLILMLRILFWLVFKMKCFIFLRIVVLYLMKKSLVLMLSKLEVLFNLLIYKYYDIFYSFIFSCQGLLKYLKQYYYVWCFLIRICICC